MTNTNPAAATEATEIHYTVIDRDSGERYSTTSSPSRDRTERERNRIALTDGKLVCLGIGRINLDGTIDDVTDDVSARRADLLSALRAHDDGTGTLGVIVDQALADDPAVTVDAVRAIVLEAIAAARAEAARA